MHVEGGGGLERGGVRPRAVPEVIAAVAVGGGL